MSNIAACCFVNPSCLSGSPGYLEYKKMMAMNVAVIKNGMSMNNTSFAIVAVPKIDPMPRGKRGFVMFDPTSVPIESALWPLMIDCKERMSSGSDEPIPIKNTAIRYWLMLSVVAMLVALSTT